MRAYFALLVVALAGPSALTGCASFANNKALPPSIEIVVSSIDPLAGKATISVINHSRSRVLVLTNILVWVGDATQTLVGRPDPGDGDEIMMTHDARLEAGRSRFHMDVRLDGSEHPSRPAVYVCWDNRAWTCDRYWLIPAAYDWETLINTASLEETPCHHRRRGHE